ncbi:MAG: NADH:flavin oxidoreductase [Gammaproteobacteria bacterium]|nr:NADH:flavin oxidoreductase [Gammaproteobacteria bacterium]MDH5345827.1 NADH:flavin oxidoreductase [Gammaproteobacteria bacterium]
MWRPAERIKYEPQPGPWPSREAAAASMLFSPVTVGPLTLAERTWVPAMVPWRATEDGVVTADVLDWYRRFAEGRPGAIVVEATGIRDIPSGPLLRIGDDRFIPGLRKLVETVRDASGGETKLFIQVIDFLRINRRPTAEKYFHKYLEITDRHREYFYDELGDDEIRERFLGMNDEALAKVLDRREFEDYAYGYRERVTDAALPHIRDLPQALPPLFASAAVRAREAGFDGVELHYAHAYTMASFLSARNTRDDGYGGDLAGRVRLPLEVYGAVREAVGSDFVVGCRFLADEIIEGGSRPDDAACFGVEFARAGMDFLSLSRGGKFEDAKQPKVGAAAYPYTGRSGYECMPQYISDEMGPFGRNLPATARVRQAIRAAGFDTPVVAAGGIHGFVEAERILTSGEADIIASARQSIADPDWFLKMRLGCGDQVRVCIYSNYCEALDTRHKQVTCELWDREDRESPGVALSADGKRRLLPPRWERPDR